MNEAKTILRFTGTKYKLHKKLKKWCVEAEQTMNGTVINLIENHLEEQSK